MNHFARKLMVTALSAGLAFSFTAPIASTPGVAASVSYCKNYARKQANKRTGAGDVLVGTAVGAGLGALTGAIVGGKKSVRTGAIIGGVGGTVVGGVETNKKWRRIYDRAYAECRSW